MADNNFMFKEGKYGFRYECRYRFYKKKSSY